MTVVVRNTVFSKEGIIKDMKLNISQIARDQGISWPTAKKIALGKTNRKIRIFKGTSKLEPYKEIIDYKLETYQCSAVALYNLIKDKGYMGSQSLVTKYVKEKKEEFLKKATIRVETTPGLHSIPVNRTFKEHSRFQYRSTREIITLVIWTTRQLI